MTVFGEPLVLPKLEAPSTEDVKKWHAKYVEVRASASCILVYPISSLSFPNYRCYTFPGICFLFRRTVRRVDAYLVHVNNTVTYELIQW